MAQGVSFQDALAQATSGNADAQYALSAALHERGRFDESLHWLRRAAAQALAPAQMTLAALLIDGRRCARDRQQAIDLLRPLAATQVQANLLLAELHGFAALGGTDRGLGLRYLCVAARLGDPDALRQLGLLGACHGRFDVVRPLLDTATRRGDAESAYLLACCFAGGIGGPADAVLAAALGHSAAAHRHYLAPRLVTGLTQPDPAAAGRAPATPGIDWRLLEESVADFARPIAHPTPEILCAAPLVRKLPGTLHPLVLDSLINLAAPLVQRSQIVDARTGEVRADPMRNSSHVTLGPRQHDHVLEAIEHCTGRVCDLPPLNGEFLQILRYRPGEEFRPHVDYFNESGPGARQSLANGGQRAQTVLIYLNDAYLGGSTTFPDLHLDIKGRRGDLLHFHNLGADGLGHRHSLHAGTPVATGEKWLLSQWMRSERYPPRLVW